MQSPPAEDRHAAAAAAAEGVNPLLVLARFDPSCWPGLRVSVPGAGKQAAGSTPTGGRASGSSSAALGKVTSSASGWVNVRLDSAGPNGPLLKKRSTELELALSPAEIAKLPLRQQQPAAAINN